jgi:hypothetical protein
MQQIARIKFRNRPQKPPNQGANFEKGVLFFPVFAFLWKVCLPINIARLKNQENPRHPYNPCPKRFVSQE